MLLILFVDLSGLLGEHKLCMTRLILELGLSFESETFESLVERLHLGSSFLLGALSLFICFMFSLSFGPSGSRIVTVAGGIMTVFTIGEFFVCVNVHCLGDLLVLESHLHVVGRVQRLERCHLSLPLQK